MKRLPGWHLWAVLLLGLSATGSSSQPPNPPAQPNVVLITVDTLRADRLGCYGYRAAETPRMDTLASQGILFERAVAQVPLTWPSHVVILTGTYPFSNGVQDFTGQPLASSYRTLAQALKDHGYATGAVVSSFVLDRSWGLARGFDFYQDALSGLAFAQQHLGPVERRGEQSTDEALKWLEGVGGRPFFLWLHLYDPHSPYDAPEPYRSRFRQRPYDGEVAYTDAQVGRLLDRLREKSVYEDTLIVLVGDHGESLGEHGESEHGFFVYNSTLRVPLIIKPATGIPFQPRRVEAPVEAADIAPTILQLAGIQEAIHRQFQSTTLVPLMAHGRAPEERAAYGETFYPFSSFGWSPLRSLQTADYHYVQAPEPELYDLQADPGEKKNLAAQEPAVAARLQERLQELVKRYPSPQLEAAGAGRSPEEIEKLRALGYVAFRARASGGVDASRLSDPKNKLAVYRAILRATTAFNAGDFSAGRAVLQQVERSDPDLYLIPFLLGEAATRQQEWGEAARQFERALTLNPGFDEALVGFGRALNFGGEREQAQEALLRAVNQNPQNYRAWFELARTQSGKNDTAGAVTSLGKALAIQPNFALGYRELGLLEMKQKDYGQAARNLARAVELGLEEPTTYNYLGIAYSRTGHLPEAVRSYERALELEPNLAEAHLNLAYAYQRLNRKAEAQQEYETACRLQPSFCRYVPQEKE